VSTLEGAGRGRSVDDGGMSACSGCGVDVLDAGGVHPTVWEEAPDEFESLRNRGPTN
jgi:hypothetical protein